MILKKKKKKKKKKKQGKGTPSQGVSENERRQPINTLVKNRRQHKLKILNITRFIYNKYRKKNLK